MRSAPGLSDSARVPASPPAQTQIYGRNRAEPCGAVRTDIPQRLKRNVSPVVWARVCVPSARSSRALVTPPSADGGAGRRASSGRIGGLAPLTSSRGAGCVVHRDRDDHRIQGAGLDLCRRHNNPRVQREQPEPEQPGVNDGPDDGGTVDRPVTVAADGESAATAPGGSTRSVNAWPGHEPGSRCVLRPHAHRRTARAGP